MIKQGTTCWSENVSTTLSPRVTCLHVCLDKEKEERKESSVLSSLCGLQNKTWLFFSFSTLCLYRSVLMYNKF